MLTPIPPPAGPTGPATPAAALRRLVQGLALPTGTATGPPGAMRPEAGAEAALRAALAQGALPLPGDGARTPQAAQGAPAGPEALPLPGAAPQQMAATGPPPTNLPPPPTSADTAAGSPQLQQGALLAAQMQPGASAAVQNLLAQIAAQRALPTAETPRSREAPRDPALLPAAQGPPQPQPGALPFAPFVQAGAGAVQEGEEIAAGEVSENGALDPRMRFVALPAPAQPTPPRAVLPWAIAGAVFVALFALALLSR
ncbi:MAG: hypothetical protein AB7U46_03460 [Paenirhodobacter sp.]|uniref:hypothetical protein n=1 Tax=Paenirhodobacter sp. TaxID=1965326 RepID=UPI003D121006